MNVKRSLLLRVPFLLILAALTAGVIYGTARKKDVCPPDSFSTDTATHQIELTSDPSWEETTADPGDKAPGPGKISFSGANFKILMSSKERTSMFSDGDRSPTLISEQLKGMSVLAEDIDINLKTVVLDDPVSYVRSAKAAGEGDTADLLLITISDQLSQMLSQGLLADLKEFGNLTALDYDEPLYSYRMDFCGATYGVSGGICTGYYDSAYVMVMDTSRRNVLELPAVIDILDGSWTLDRFCEICAAAKAADTDPVGKNIRAAVAIYAGAGGHLSDISDGYIVVNHIFEDAELKKLRSAFSAGTDSGTPVFRVMTVSDFAKYGTEGQVILPLPAKNADSGYETPVDAASATAFAVTSFCSNTYKSAAVLQRAFELSRNGTEDYIVDLCAATYTDIGVAAAVFENTRIDTVEALGFADAINTAVGDYLLGTQEYDGDLFSRRKAFVEFAMGYMVSSIANTASDTK